MGRSYVLDRSPLTPTLSPPAGRGGKGGAHVIVCLGATAAQAMLGRSFKVSRERDRFVTSPPAPRVIATVHPSSLLRAPDEAARRAETARFVADLKKVPAAIR